MHKKVLIISNVTGGLVNFRRELLETMSTDYDMTVLAAENLGRDFLESIGCRFINIELERQGKNPLKDVRLYHRYYEIIKSINPDVVLTYTIKPNIYGGAACARLGIPYICNVTGLGEAVEKKGIMQIITIPMYRYGIRKAQKVFFQNSDNQDFMLRHRMVSGAYDLLPGSGVNLDKYTPLAYPKDGTIQLVFISRIIKEKGIDQFIDAAKSIHTRYPYVQFHVYGNCEQNYERTLQGLHREGILVYHGRVNNIPEIHQFSSCTVHPTYYPEGMSNVLLESCACARPIITTDRPGCREIVDDGVNGFVVKQKDSADLIEKIEKFLALTWEQRRDMGLAGRAKVEREFDRNIVVRKYLEEIERA